MNSPIFSEFFLNKFLYDFNLSSISNIRQIKTQLESLIQEFESGKFESLKEEEIKSRFVTTFFGDILHFNYGNGKTWMLREEKKSVVDGTKPDAALGYFFSDNKKDQVRVVIEVKDCNTDLDEKQKRSKTISAVEQGFGYAHKAGGNCTWVIVTNLKEIRFYRSQDSSRYQVYFLQELKDENKLKELLFLFHKDRFIKFNIDEKSNTDILFELSKLKQENETERLHIIDKIYYSLKRFEQLGFVTPEYLASIMPFNILEEYVWHYNDGKLFTLNPTIYHLLNQVTISEGNILFSDILKNEVEDLNQAIERLNWSFSFLNRCLVTKIYAVKDYKLELQRKKNVIGILKTHMFNCEEDNKIELEIDLIPNDDNCDCMICNYRNFDFNKLIRKVAKAQGNSDYQSMEFAFINFLISSNDYRTSYFILDEIRNKMKNTPENGITYFLASLNSTFLYNSIQMSSLDDTEQLRMNIRSIDLDKVLYNELEYYVEKEVLLYLKKIKEDDLVYEVQDNVEKLFKEINKLKRLIDAGGNQTGPNYAYNLLLDYEKFFKHHYYNFIFYVKFYRYKKISERILEALIISYNTPGHGLIFFNDFIITESILNIQTSSLQEILSNQEYIDTDYETIEKLILKLKNLLNSYIKKGLFNDYIINDVFVTKLENWAFEQQYNSIFANIFIFLSKIDLKMEQFKPVKSLLIAYLDIEDSLAHFHLKELENFILKHGNLFEDSELENILNIAIKRDKIHNHKYEGLLRNIPIALVKYKPDYRYTNSHLVKKLLLNCEREDGTFKNYRKAINVAQITDESCKNILCTVFKEFLDKTFDSEFYTRLLHAGVLKFDEGEYFKKYVLEVNNTKKFRSLYLMGDLYIDLNFLNFILLISKLKINYNYLYFEYLKNLNSFERWLLNPQSFNYTFFDTDWLIAIAEYPAILSRLKDIIDINTAIEDRISENYNPILAEIKYKYVKS